MITIIEGLPDYVAGFEASGEVTKHDYDTVLIPAVNEVTKRTGELYYLFIMRSGLGHFSAGAMFDDLKVGLQHITQWKKMAIVSDSKVIEKFTDLFSYIVPGQSKGFPIDKVEEAKQWVSEKL